MKTTLIASALIAAAGFAQAQSATYGVDPTHTFVTFEAQHFGTSTLRGRFDRKEGTVQLDRAGKSGKAEITIDITSVSTGGSGGEDRLTENISLNFAEVKFIYKPQKPDGTLGDALPFTYNIAANHV